MTANQAWIKRLHEVLLNGSPVSPRGTLCLEELHQTISCGLEHSLITVEERKLNYRFAAAEALWIINGSNLVRELTPYNKRMAEFSDDGTTLAGAYGPRIMSQLHWVKNKLLEDLDTRQAVASIWTPLPPRSKDIPCTLALTFMVRGDELHCHAFMRSSDVWLGIPYDLFSFSQVALLLLAWLNADIKPIVRWPKLTYNEAYKPGRLWITAASSHLYDSNREQALAILASYRNATLHLQPLPTRFSEEDLRQRLHRLLNLGEGALVTKDLA